MPAINDDNKKWLPLCKYCATTLGGFIRYQANRLRLCARCGGGTQDRVYLSAVPFKALSALAAKGHMQK